jgi:hypothetical protein
MLTVFAHFWICKSTLFFSISENFFCSVIKMRCPLDKQQAGKPVFGFPCQDNFIISKRDVSDFNRPRR